MGRERDNMRELSRKEMDLVNGGTGSASGPMEEALPKPDPVPFEIDPIIPDPGQDNYSLKCTCRNCGFKVTTIDAAGPYYVSCPNCHNTADWIWPT